LINATSWKAGIVESKYLKARFDSCNNRSSNFTKGLGVIIGKIQHKDK
jgi:hypothetical protein